MGNDLTIEQLADLKIAIDKNRRVLTEVNNELRDRTSMSEHLKNENIRLDKEIKQQVEIKENLIAENETIRKEKEGIQSEYEKRNAEVYADIKAKQEKLDSDMGILEQRLIECDKRERDISAKNDGFKESIKEIETAKKTIGEEKLVIENIYKDVETQREKLIKEKENLAEQEIKTLEAITANQTLLVEIRNREQDIATIHAKTSEKLVEIRAREKFINEVLPKLEGFKTYLKEVKDFVIENGYTQEKTLETLEDIEKETTESTIETKEIENKITENNEETQNIKPETTENIETIETKEEENSEISTDKEIIDLESLSVTEIKEKLDQAGIDYNKNNNNKSSLIKLLTNA